VLCYVAKVVIILLNCLHIFCTLNLKAASLSQS
jgi:hypothetical protein